MCVTLLNSVSVLNTGTSHVCHMNYVIHKLLSFSGFSLLMCTHILVWLDVIHSHVTEAVRNYRRPVILKNNMTWHTCESTMYKWIKQSSATTDDKTDQCPVMEHFLSYLWICLSVKIYHLSWCSKIIIVQSYVSELWYVVSCTHSVQLCHLWLTAFGNTVFSHCLPAGRVGQW